MMKDAHKMLQLEKDEAGEGRAPIPARFVFARDRPDPQPEAEQGAGDGRFLETAARNRTRLTIGSKALFKRTPEPTRHEQRLVNQRFSRRRLWGSLVLVGSNFLGNSWAKSG